MDHNSFIKEIPGNGPIFFQSWLPSKKPSAIMILIHGFGEHSSRYGTHFAEFYTNSNIGIFLLTCLAMEKPLEKEVILPILICCWRRSTY